MRIWNWISRYRKMINFHLFTFWITWKKFFACEPKKSILQTMQLRALSNWQVTNLFLCADKDSWPLSLSLSSSLDDEDASDESLDELLDDEQLELSDATPVSFFKSTLSATFAKSGSSFYNASIGMNYRRLGNWKIPCLDSPSNVCTIFWRA